MSDSTIVVISRDGSLATRLQNNELSVHAAIPIEGSRFLRAIKLQGPLTTEVKFVKISAAPSTISDVNGIPSGEEGNESVSTSLPQRLVCASSNRMTIWQAHNLEWHADIENMDPGVTAVDFGANDDEAILFHAWSSKLTIFNLNSAASVIIKSPKFCSSSSLGYAFRPQTKQLAILLKPEGTDLLTIHEPFSYDAISRISLPTVDAQGLQWSPDGRWIAVWDAASYGTKLVIYTADGQQFRTYTGRTDIQSTHDLGIKCVQWAPFKARHQVSEVLAIGKYDGTVDLLNTRTVCTVLWQLYGTLIKLIYGKFSCSTTLSHTFYINANSPRIWRERMSPEGDFEYAEAMSSSAFMALGSETTSSLPKGVSILQFSSHGEFLATLDQTRANIVWIWAMNSPPVLVTVLVHDHNVKNLTWHPNKQELLITTANNTVALVHLWSRNRDPVIIQIPISRSESARYEATWVRHKAIQEMQLFWFSNGEDAVLGHITVNEAMDKHSFSALYAISRGC